MAGQIVNVSTSDLISETALKCGDALMTDFPRNIYSQAVFRAQRAVAKRFAILDRTYSFTNTTAVPGALHQEFDIGPLNFDGAWRVTVERTGDPANLSYATPGSIDTTTGTVTTYIIDFQQVQVEQVERKLLSLPLATVYPDYGIPAASAHPIGLPFNGMLPPYRYSINYQANRYVFSYSDPLLNDIITIYYTSSIAGEEDFEPFDAQGNPNIIPILPNKYYEETLRRAIIYMAEMGAIKFRGDKSKQWQLLLRIHSKPEDQDIERGLEKDRPFIQIRAFSTQFPGD